MRTSRSKQRGFWSYVIPAAASLIGGYLSKQGQDNANQDNLQIAREQMGFQERMSNTAYQRQMADMEKAGINPMLASQSGGASAPAGASATMQNAVGAGVNSALAGMQTMTAGQQIVANKAQTEQMNAQTRKIESETMERNLNSALLAAQVRKAQEEGSKTREEVLGARYESQRKQMEYRAERGDEELDKTGWAADVRRRKAAASLTESDVARAKAEEKFFSSDFGVDSPYIRSIVDIIRGITSATGAARNLSGR